VENVCGSEKRLNWIRTRLKDTDRVLEFGCGTGAMITLPLLATGYDVVGIDLDRESIDYGRDLLRGQGLDPMRLRDADLNELADASMDTIIASEVLEHIGSPELGTILRTLNSKLRPGGCLLVTVPNGFGWFELESFLWSRLRVGRILLMFHVPGIISRIKQFLRFPVGPRVLPNTLSASPHVQRFTHRSISAALQAAGFQIISIQGTVMFAGQFSHVWWGGVSPFIRLNLSLGARFPHAAAGYLIDCLRPIDAP